MRFVLMLGFFLWTFETVHSADPIPIQIHVSTSGLDTSSGRAEEPLATLVGARDLIRSLRDSGHIDDRAIEVLVRPGVYRHPHAIEFTLQDSWTEEFPIRYRSVGGQAILSGGIALHAWTKLKRSDLLDRIPLSARPQVVCFDLRAYSIHDGPDVAIGLNGNEHLVEHNEIARVCKETDDTGAIYLSYDPTYRGNLIRRNYIHDLGGFSKTGVIGIYLDDFASGTVVSNNYLCNTIRGIVIGGGSDNRIENNIVRESLAAIQIDARGLTWASDMIQGENSAILTLCRNTITDSPISLQRYPELSSVFRNDLATPRGNVVRRNLFETRIGIDLQDIARELVAIDGNSRWSSARLATHSEDRTESILSQLGIELSTNTRGRTVETERTFPVSTTLESTSTR